MPFPSALSAGQITQVRQTSQAFEHYLLVNPNDIVWQADVDDTKSAENYADFEWTNTLQGNTANVMVGMVVLVTDSTTDFSNPIFRGRIRKDLGATTVYCNETGTDIDDTMYVTVLDDFDLMERLQRLGGDGTKYKDWDLTFEDLPPIIDGLQSTYVDFSESNPVAFSFSPTATAAASGAAISTWLWDIDDGSFTGGTSDSDQNIQCTFPGYGVNEHRWVHLTVTDDAGNSTTFHFEVYTVAKNSSTAVKLDSGNLQITGTVQDGWNATITNWDGMAISEVLDETRVTIAGVDDYNGTATPIVSNILMIGRLRREEPRSEADAVATLDTDTLFTIEGFGTQLANLPAPALSITDDAAPAAWGEITNPTPYRAIVYFLAFHTTFCTLCSLSSDDLSDYVLGDFSLGETSGLDNVNKQMESVNGIIAFAPAGEATLRRMASYQSDADRAGLTTVFGFTTTDITPNAAFPYDYGEVVGEIEAGAVVYNTTSDDIDFRYIGRAPASSFGSGHESVQLNGQVLVADSTDATARSELTQRTADHLAYVNPKVRLSVGLMDGFWWLVPTLHQRYTFTLAATDTARGRAFTTSNYWQLVSINYSADNDTNERLVLCTFERETQGGNAGVSVTLIPDPNDLDYSLPPMSAYDFFPDDGLTNFPVDDPDIDPYYGGGMADTLEPSPGGYHPAANCETFNVPMFGPYSRQTTRNTVLGQTYTITVKGDTDFPAGWSEIWDFTSSNGSWTANDEGAGARGTYSGGTGWVSSNLNESGNRSGIVNIYKEFGAEATVTDITMTFDFNQGESVAPPNQDTYIQGWTGGFKGSSEFQSFQDSSTGDDQTFAWNGSDVLDAVDVRIRSSYKAGSDPSPWGDATITQIQIEGTGSNPFGADGSDRGDAFYTDYVGGSANLYAAGQGLLINAATPGGIPPFQGNHEYTFTFTGTGAALTFLFFLSDYTGVGRNNLQITICGPNMGVTAP